MKTYAALKVRTAGKGSLKLLLLLPPGLFSLYGWFICLFVNRITQKVIKLNMTKLAGRVGHGPLNFGVNLDPEMDLKTFM